jgi:hypothetical protein
MRELAIMIQNLLRREEGQDLIEYALVVSLIAPPPPLVPMMTPFCAAAASAAEVMSP